MTDISDALKQIDQNSSEERIALMNSICERIIERKDTSKTSLEAFIFAMHGFIWNSPRTGSERIIAQTYDNMVAKHPSHRKGTPVARLLLTDKTKNHYMGIADPLLIGRIDKLTYNIKLHNDTNELPLYVGGVCLSLSDVHVSVSSQHQDAAQESAEELVALSDSDKLVNVADVDLVLARAKRSVSAQSSSTIDEYTDVAYGWNNILEVSDLRCDKGPRLLGHIAILMNQWEQ